MGILTQNKKEKNELEGKMSQSVVREWVAEKCTLKQQTVLLCALRGCDGIDKEDVSKSVVRMLRDVVLYNADESSTFILDTSKNRSYNNPESRHLINGLLDNSDKYHHHWLLHFIHAAEILGFKHPDATISGFWRRLYYDSCSNFHMNPESEEEMDIRLR